MNNFGPSQEEVAILSAYYKAHHKLPMKHVMCTQSGRLITMFGPNLHNRVNQYNTIENLLSTFVCRAAKTEVKTLNPVVPKEKKHKKGWTPRDEIPYTEQEHPRTVYSMEELASSPKICAEFTTGSCFRPDYYLDNNKRCNGCMLLDNCCSSNKRIKVS